MQEFMKPAEELILLH